jgi:hypothetical protein
VFEELSDPVDLRGAIRDLYGGRNAAPMQAAQEHRNEIEGVLVQQQYAVIGMRHTRQVFGYDTYQSV